jgi:predicted nucleic acid-binding Zn ribbon protein
MADTDDFGRPIHVESHERPHDASRVRPRRSPRPLGDALRQARARAEPLTLLAAAQSAWPIAAGARVAAEAEPVAERDGVLTIACRSSTWAQELDLLGPELLERLNGALSEAGRGASEPPVRALRFTADAARHIGRVPE